MNIGARLCNHWENTKLYEVRWWYEQDFLQIDIMMVILRISGTSCWVDTHIYTSDTTNCMSIQNSSLGIGVYFRTYIIHVRRYAALTISHLPAVEYIICRDRRGHIMNEAAAFMNYMWWREVYLIKYQYVSGIFDKLIPENIPMATMYLTMPAIWIWNYKKNCKSELPAMSKRWCS